MKNILILYFLVGVGWDMEGVGSDGDSPEGKPALSTPTASRPTRFKVRQLYLTVPLSIHVVATDKELVWPPQRGWETRREATRAKNLTLSLQYVIQNRTARPNVEGGGWFPDKPG